ncbi:MAG: exodeoxyribonuclease VII large subunit [Lachnospiraceae bacterium]|nr:exodeoxyribonuclease VII large subunit [Lachnospiraceae bacterium]
MNVYSVSRINSYIAGMFREDFILGSLAVKGEVSSVKYHSSGHIYFAIKDEKSVLNCIMFKGSREEGLRFRLEEGMEIRVTGAIRAFERDGNYSLYAEEIVQEGAGRLYEMFLQMKNRLEESGMFAEEYKQPIPKYVRNVGIVTAPTGAVIQDIRNVAGRRNPYVQLILYPTGVQGEAAADGIIRGIKTLEKMGVDVIIVGRGGGSMEDLWVFNSERIAQAVFDCTVPVISAVGHETDTTIIDFVADLRAPTPSAAAELAVYDYREFEAKLEHIRETLGRSVKNKISLEKSRMKALEANLKRLSPGMKLMENRMVLARFSERLSDTMENKLKDRRHKLSILIEKLNGLSPLAKLNQGFGYVEKEKKTVSSIRDIGPEDRLKIYVSDGILNAKVESVEEAPGFMRKGSGEKNG